MSEPGHTDEKPETLTREANQVDGVLQDYLDQLLVVATERIAAPAVTKTLIEQAEELVPDVSVVTVEQTSAVATEEIQDWDPYADSETSPATVSVTEHTAESASESVRESEATMTVAPTIEETAGTKHELLDWDSTQGVECLLFSVAGLKLAIPLSLLGGVHPADASKVTPLFGQKDWSLGVWQSDSGKLTVVDSARLIMPERGVSLKDTGYGYLIQLDRAPWALACEGICDTITLGSSSIKWRGDASKRPWLAGTVISEMCALLDVPSLIELLDSRQLAS